MSTFLISLKDGSNDNPPARNAPYSVGGKTLKLFPKGSDAYLYSIPAPQLARPAYCSHLLVKLFFSWLRMLWITQCVYVSRYLGIRFRRSDIKGSLMLFRTFLTS